MWFTQLCNRIFPILLHEVTDGKPLHGGHIVYGMQLTQHCLGSCSNCAIRTKMLLPRLQKMCEFEEGECIVIFCWSFPSFGSVAHYQVVDLKKGELFSGEWSASEASSCTKPSDCQRFASRIPFKR